MIRVKELLKSSRAAANLTVEALAARSGLLPGIIHRAEQGMSLPTPNNAKAMDAALGLCGRLVEEVRVARGERAKTRATPDATRKGMAFVRRSLAEGPLADRVRLLEQLTHAQSRAIREAIDARLKKPDGALVPSRDGLHGQIVNPKSLRAPALDVHVLGAGPRRRKA